MAFKNINKGVNSPFRCGKQERWNKKYLILFCMLFFAGMLFLFLGTSVFAQDPLDVGLEPLEDIGLSSEDPRVIVAKLIRVFLGFLGIIGLVICVYAGYLWMTSQGDEAKVEKAKQLLVNGAIGLFIILASYAIVSYVIHLLLYGVPRGGSEPPPFIDRDALGRGALGAGMIQSHYPPRDATGIPRNTNIIITFKAPMDLDSIARWDRDHDANGTMEWDDSFLLWLGDTDPEGVIGPDKSEFNIEVFLSDTPTRFFNAHVYFLQGEFPDTIKTIVIDPDEYLGSPTEELKHKVELKSGILTKMGQEPFKLFSYIWEFETSVALDFTPPVLNGMQREPLYTPPPHMADPSVVEDFNVYQGKRVKGEVIPFSYPLNHPCNDPIQDRDADGDGEADDTDGDGEPDCRTWSRNVLIQINFNEAVNPLTVSGQDSFVKVYANQYGIQGDPDGLGPQGADDDLADWIPVPGEWRMSSDYKSVEFWPLEEGGVNSCGEKIFVLPGQMVLRIYIVAATPQDPDPTSPNYTPQRAFPFDGVVDVAGNAFDGNADTFATSGYVNGKDDGTFDDNIAIPPTSYDLSDDDFDDFVFVFDTSNEIDLTPPILIDLEPDDHAGFIAPSNPFMAEFNKFISTTSLLPNNTIILWGQEQDPENPGTPWERCAEACPIPGTLMSYIGTTLLDGDDPGDEVDHHRANINHERLQTEPETLYAPVITKHVKDLYQNCYEGACLGALEGSPVDTDPTYRPGNVDYDPNTDALPPTSAGCRDYPIL